MKYVIIEGKRNKFTHHEIECIVRCVESNRVIGCYSSRSAARRAVNRLSAHYDYELQSWVVNNKPVSEIEYLRLT